jgi:hypothetical protein
MTTVQALDRHPLYDQNQAGRIASRPPFGSRKSFALYHVVTLLTRLRGLDFT